MKSVLLSVRPQHVANILNGLKTIEIRKKFPKDYVGWVYIYCTKDKDYDVFNVFGEYHACFRHNREMHIKRWRKYPLNGKVVARFWCDKVEEILLKQNGNYYTNTLSNNKLLTQSCLTQSEMFDYLAGNWQQKFNYWYGGYAIHITKLEIFDKPKEIKEFSHYDNSQYQALPNGEQYKGVLEPLTRAPQSWCYIEV